MTALATQHAELVALMSALLYRYRVTVAPGCVTVISIGYDPTTAAVCELDGARVTQAPAGRILQLYEREQFRARPNLDALLSALNGVPARGAYAGVLDWPGAAYVFSLSGGNSPALNEND